MFKNKYNIIMISICAFLLVLSTVIFGINYNTNKKYDKTNELYKNSIIFNLNENTIDAELSPKKWKSYKGDFVSNINIKHFAEEYEIEIKNGVIPIVDINIRVDINKEFDGEFTLERIVISNSDLDSNKDFEKEGKKETITSVEKVNDTRYMINDKSQDLNDSYYHMYYLHYKPNDEKALENYWCFGIHFSYVEARED